MSWPSVDFETLPWVSSMEIREQLSRREAAQIPQHYQSALVPKIEHAQLDLKTETFTRLERASLEVIRFDADQATAIIPFTALLLRSESVASSRIENLTASARKIFEAEIASAARSADTQKSAGDSSSTGAVGTKNAQLILANTRQMEEATKEAEVSTQGLLDVHRVLLADSAPNIAGRFREEPVWIGGKNYFPVDALFVPPAHGHIPALMADLEAFCQRSDLPAIAHVAIAHAQLETIHPFADGNGRTGRALIHILLRARGLTQNAALPISAGLLRDTGAYFEALNTYREGNPVPIIELFADSARHAVARGRWLATELRELEEQWRSLPVGNRGNTAWDVLPLLMQRPVLTARIVAETLGTSDETARTALQRLEKVDILRSATGPVRGTTVWRAPEILEILDEFAEGMGRRGTA